MEDRAPQIQIQGLDAKDSTILKTLGMIYRGNPFDQFTYQFNLSPPKVWTKRNILGIISKIYDPVSFLAPYTASARMTFQELIKKFPDYGWDTPIKTEDLGDFLKWFAHASRLNEVEIPRCIQRHKDEDTKFEREHPYFKHQDDCVKDEDCLCHVWTQTAESLTGQELQERNFEELPPDLPRESPGDDFFPGEESYALMCAEEKASLMGNNIENTGIAGKQQA